MTFQVRHATVEDAELVRAVLHAAFDEYRDLAVTPGALSETVEDVRGKISEGNTLLALYEGKEGSDTEAVGTVRYEVRTDHLYVRRLAVLPGWRRRGVGKLLVEHIEQTALSLGYPCIKLATGGAMKANVDFYRDLGYEIVDETPHPRGPDTILWFEKKL